MAGNKPINKSLRGIRDSMPPGYVLGRTGTGNGPPQLIPAGAFTTKGYVANTTIQVGGAAGGDLSGTYPNPTVIALQGNAIQSGVPTNLAVLLYHTAGATWLPVVLGAVAYSGSYLDLTNLPPLTGGTTGQVLTKNSNSDYDFHWTTNSVVGGPASIQDDGTTLYIALSDSDGQLVVDGSGDPIFAPEVLPISSIPNPAGYISGPYSAVVVNKVKGITDGSNAAAGDVGELLQNSITTGSSVSLTAGTWANVVSITLTPGDWNVWGKVAFNGFSGITTTFLRGAINTVSATPPGAETISYVLEGEGGGATGLGAFFGIPNVPINVTTNTTVYLLAETDSGTGIGAYGTIMARRVR